MEPDGGVPSAARLSRRTTALALAVAAVVVALNLVFMMSNGMAARSVAANAHGLHWTNSMLGSAAIARAANAQAVVFAVDHQLGVASDSALQTATDEARRAFNAATTTLEGRPAAYDTTVIDPALDRYVEINDKVLDLIEGGQVDKAVSLSQGEFEVAYAQLREVLGAEQARISEAIDATESTVGRVASFAGVAVTLLIPATAILIYFLLARRQMRELRNATEAKIDAARHLARAKDELIAGLSHELRTPLTSIYGFSELLLGTGMVDPRQAKELLAVINSESAELSRMVEDLLTASRLDAGAISFELTEVALHTEIGAVLEPFQRGGLAVVVDCVPATIRADRLRLRQVLRNLISNAQKHGGPNILIESRIRGDKVMIAVIDDGAGVPSAIEARLFQRFVHDGRHALLAGSVGLGLSIAKTLIEAMGGSMVYQQVDGWTAFTFTLPVSRAEQETGSLDLMEKERKQTREDSRRLEPVRGGR